MVERKHLEVSPVAGLKSVFEDEGKDTTYSEQEESAFDTTKTENENFYLATRFVRYLFLCRTELSRIQINICQLAT